MASSVVLKALLDLLSLVLIGIIPVLAVKIVNFINTKIALGKEKARTENEKRILESIEKTVETVVLYVSQTFVDTLKASGKFTEKEQTIAFKMALEKTQEMLTEEAKEFIMVNYGDITAWLTTLIEAAVKTNKALTITK